MTYRKTLLIIPIIFIVILSCKDSETPKPQIVDAEPTCDTYPDQETSPHVLPYSVGESYRGQAIARLLAGLTS